VSNDLRALVLLSVYGIITSGFHPTLIMTFPIIYLRLFCWIYLYRLYFVEYDCLAGWYRVCRGFVPVWLFVVSIVLCIWGEKSSIASMQAKSSKKQII